MSENPPPISSYLSTGEVTSGPGASSRAGAMLTAWSVTAGSTVAFVLDADIADLGLAEAARQSVERAGFHTHLVICDKGEPRLTGVERVVSEVRAASPSACIGVGGGSAMDTAKLAAAMVTNPGAVADYLGIAKVHEASIPTIMIPTTSGTGSETTIVSMLSRDGKKVVVASPPLMPRAAILDPNLATGLPRSVTAASGLDALSHGIESYLSLRANPVTMGASLAGAHAVADAIRGAADNPSDLGYRMGMLAGAFWSGLGLNANVVIGHSIAYTIANRTGLPHGVTCSMALPYCLAYNERQSHGRIETIWAVLGQESASGAELPGIYGWLNELASALAIPASLTDVGLSRSDVEPMAIECMESYPRPNNPVPFDRDELIKLYTFMADGDLAGCLAEFRN